MLRLCLVGGDVGASRSVAMQMAALQARGVEGLYTARSVSADQLDGFIAELRAGAYDGCNVTMPHKLAMAAACDIRDADAQLLGAVNTIKVVDARLHGSNTDVAGFARGLAEHDLTPEPDAHALVLGAGGAAAAVVLALLRMPVRRVTLLARRAGAAVELAGRLAGAGAVVTAPWDQAAGSVSDADLVVNATSAGLPAMPFDVRDLPPSCTVADVRNRPRPVDLVAAAEANGLRACDGLVMLVHQGALSFETWTGVSAPVEVMRAAVQQAAG